MHLDIAEAHLHEREGWRRHGGGDQFLLWDYIEKRGNLDKFAAMFGVNASLIRRNRPTDGRDFAKKILAGFYTGDVGGIEKKELRNHLRENLQRKVSQLKRTTTKEYAGLNEEDIRAVRRSTTRWLGTWTRSPGRATFPSRS